MIRSRIAAPLAALAWAATVGASTELPSALEAGWAGAPVCTLLHQTETHRVLRCTFPPGVGHERHFHPAHFGYALSGGTMELTDAGGVRIAKIATGAHYKSDGTPWHSVRNVGDVIGTPVQPVVQAPTPAPAGPGVNGVQNPSFQTTSTTSPSGLKCWQYGGYGANTPTFGTVVPGRVGTNTRAATLSVSGYQDGDVEEGMMPAGQGVEGVHAVLPAGDIVRAVVAEAESILARLR